MSDRQRNEPKLINANLVLEAGLDDRIRSMETETRRRAKARGVPMNKITRVIRERKLNRTHISLRWYYNES